MKPSEIKSFDDLKRFLANYTSWDNGHALDSGGLFILLGAILNNLRENAIDADLRMINGYLEDDQKKLLYRLTEYAMVPEDE